MHYDSVHIGNGLICLLSLSSSLSLSQPHSVFTFSSNTSSHQTLDKNTTINDFVFQFMAIGVISYSATFAVGLLK